MVPAPAAMLSASSEPTTPSVENFKIYLCFSFIKFDISKTRKLFRIPRGHGMVLAPNRGVRGASRDISERIKALQEYFALKSDAQKIANDQYKNETSKSLKRDHRANYTFLDSKAAKVEAIANHPQGDEIASSANFNANEEAASSAVTDRPGAPDGRGRGRTASASGTPFVLSADDKLRFFLQINLIQINVALCRQLFQSRGGRHFVPNWGVRGSHNNSYADVIDALVSFFSLSPDEQQEANKVYRERTSNTIRRKHKLAFQTLNTDTESLRAIRDHPNGVEIADSLDFDIAGIGDIPEIEEDVVVPHVGLASSEDSLQSLSERTDQPNNGRRGGSRVHSYQNRDSSNSVKHLSRTIHTTYFYKAAKAVARCNDATFLDPDMFPGNPTRTNILISFNGVMDVNEAGGCVKNNNRRKRPKLTLVADNPEMFAFVMRMLNDAKGRTALSHPERYEVEEIFREGEKNLEMSVGEHKSAFHHQRSNPKRKRSSEEECLQDIITRTNNTGGCD